MSTFSESERPSNPANELPRRPTADANSAGYLSETEFKSWSASSSPSSSFGVAVELELIVVTLEHNRFVDIEFERFVEFERQFGHRRLDV
jgi:hypothetical protein